MREPGDRARVNAAPLNAGDTSGRSAGPSGQPDELRRAVIDVPKPLLRQILLLVPMALDLVMLMIWGDPRSVGGFYVVGLSVLLATTAVAAITSFRQLPGWVLLLLPVLDLAAIGLMRLVPEGNGLGILAVLPAMWLAADYRMRGVGLGLAATLGLLSLPSMLYFGLEPSWASRGVLIPVAAVMCALTVAGTAQVWARQNEELSSQRHRLERALDEVMANRALNEAIVSTVDVGLVALDRHGDYQAINPQHAEFLQLAYPDGHHGKAGQPGHAFGADRVTPLEGEALPTVRAMNGERFTDHVMWVGRDPASQKALSVSASPILDTSGRFDGAVLVYQDITELMAALKVKDDFVASVSHELRTPLTSIMGYLDLVLDEDDSVSPVVRRQLDAVKRNSERLLRLVSDLLLAGQAHGGPIPLELEPADISSTVEQALAEHARGAALKSIALRQQLSSALVMNADPTRVRQIVDNLVGNAIKYTQPGGEVTVRLAQHEQEVELVVSDTGIGIAPAEVGRLFTRFFRTQDAESRAIQGIGLGLAITKSIVEAHGGRIEVASEVGQGTTFTVYLPRCGPSRDGDLVADRQPRPAAAVR